MTEVPAVKRRSGWKELSDVTPEQRVEIKRLNRNVWASVPPKRPKNSFAYYEAYERHECLHIMAKSQRSDWLVVNRIPLRVARYVGI
jgi:hypothetical protein